MKAIAATILVFLAVIVFWLFIMGVTAECFGLAPKCLFDKSGWVWNYQTLLSGVLALAAAGLVFAQGLSQIAFQREQLDQQAVADAARRRIDAVGLLNALQTNLNRMWGALGFNNEQEYLDAVRSAYRTSETFARYYSPQLGNWIDFQIGQSTAWTNHMFRSNDHVAESRRNARAHIVVAQRYLDNREQLLSPDGNLVLRAFTAPDVFETIEQTGLEQRRFMVEGYFHR